MKLSLAIVAVAAVAGATQAAPVPANSLANELAGNSQSVVTDALASRGSTSEAVEELTHAGPKIDSVESISVHDDFSDYDEHDDWKHIRDVILHKHHPDVKLASENFGRVADAYYDASGRSDFGRWILGEEHEHLSKAWDEAEGLYVATLRNARKDFHKTYPHFQRHHQGYSSAAQEAPVSGLRRLTRLNII